MVRPRWYRPCKIVVDFRAEQELSGRMRLERGAHQGVDAGVCMQRVGMRSSSGQNNHAVKYPPNEPSDGPLKRFSLISSITIGAY